MDNALLHASGNYPAHKIEEQINLILIHVCLYLAESYDERDNKPAAANTFNISCGGVEYSFLFYTITVSVLDNSDLVCC